MKFARIQGHGRLLKSTGEQILSLVITLDDGRTVKVVSDAPVAWLPFGPAGDAAWQIDQYTQEALGGALADEGWEVVSQDETANVVDSDGISHSCIFVARKASWE